MRRHIPGNPSMTYADQELQNVFSIMESNGLNVTEFRRRMNMSIESMHKADMKKIRKHNRKTESAIIQRITKLNRNPKFKKLIAKAEKKISEQMQEY